MSILNRLRGALGLRLAAPLDAERPTGKYELLGRRCIGTVQDRWSPTSSPMVIEVESVHRQVLQTLSVRATNDHGRYDFAFELESGMEPRAFLSDQIGLYARNVYGLRGKLPLDGGSQLALIREHLGKPRTVLFDLDFTRGSNAQACMVEGWGAPEPKVCCSDGPRAVLRVPVPLRMADRYELTITCFPFLFPPRVADQRMILSMNEYVHTASLDARALEFFSFIFPDGSLNDSDAALLKFEFPDCTCPNDLHINEDTRLLAFGFKQMVLARLLDVTV